MKKIVVFIFLITCNIGYSQPGTWTWKHGFAGSGGVQFYGTQGVPSPQVVPPAIYQGCGFADHNGNFWIFGGIREVPSGLWWYGDTWKYDPVINQWTWVKGTPNASNGHYGTMGVSDTLNCPPSKSYGAACWVDNNNDFWLYGGVGNLNYRNDLWKYNIASNTWTWMHGSNSSSSPPVYGVQGVPDPLNTPGSREEMGSTWVDSTNNLWLFGGTSIPGNQKNDLWKYDTSTNEWTWMKGDMIVNPPSVYGSLGVEAASNVPGGRMSHAKWKDLNGDFWIFGGSPNTIGPLLNDLWRYRPSTNNWTWMDGNASPVYSTKCVPSGSRLPNTRYEHGTCWTDNNGNFWMYGGGGYDLTIGTVYYNDLWMLNPTTLEWTYVNGDSTNNNNPIRGTLNIPSVNNTPGGRSGALAWYQPPSNLYLTCGANKVGTGTGSFKQYNDVMVYEINPLCPLLTGISENIANGGILISPNPAMHEFQISFLPGNTSGLLFNQGNEIIISDVTGRIVYSEKVPSATSDLMISTESYPNGLYFVQIVAGNNSYTDKVLVNH